MSYIRISLSGTLGNQEVWSVNPAFNETTNVGNWDQEVGQKAADAVAAVAVPAALKSLASSAVVGTRVRVERRSDAGALIGAAEAAWSGMGAGTGTATKPPQTSTVLSLRSNVPGARGRGRLYWPALGASISPSTLRIAGGVTIDNIATAAATYLDGLASALKGALAPAPSLIDYDLCVVSPTTGTRTRIIRIEVGDVLDVQRRRRDRMPEQYFSVAMP